MNVYDINIGYYDSSQIHSVVAESMAEAERIYHGKYPYNVIRSIKLHSEYVQIQGLDEQKKEQ